MIKIQDIRKSFGGIEILKGIDLEIQQGEFVTLLGASGCGKSTLLRIIAGLEKADHGSLLHGDKCLDDAQTDVFIPTQQRKFGFVFQDHALWPHLTIAENVAFPLKSYHWKKANITERVEIVLKQVQMLDHLRKFPRQLSGGQRQRVGIARALALSPEVILLDEPLASLDSNLRDELGHEIRSLAKQFGLTCINVTHDRREAQILSDRIAVMSSGQIQQVGAPLEVFTEPKTVDIAQFLNAGNIVPSEILPRASGRGSASLLVPRSAFRIVPNGGDIKAEVRDFVFIDGRFEVTVTYMGHDLIFFSDSEPDRAQQINLEIHNDAIVPLQA